MRCVLYLRMSTEEQEDSIEGQRRELKKYAAKSGYRIVAEYVDEGISGDATEKRLEFQRMIADCGSKRFDIILAWDQDRFGRFDPLEAGYWIKPMRDAGVILETIAQGKIDWNDFAGRLIWSVTQEAKHSFLRDLARNSLRGNINRAKQGKSNGVIPYGYARGEDGHYVLGDPDEIKAVQRIFKLRLQGYGNHVIARMMREEGWPTPSVCWAKDSVRHIVERESYTGVMIFSKNHHGKYQTTAADGSVVKTVGKRKNTSPIRIENAHEPIISREDWIAAQSTRKPHTRGDGQGSPLAGLLFCECGFPMYTERFKNAQPAYICSQYQRGRGCGCKRVRQGWMHEQVEAVIQHLMQGRWQELAEVVAETQRQNQVTSIRQDLEKRLAAIEKKISTASERILSVNSRLVADLEKKLLAMHEERDAIERQLSEPEEIGVTPEEMVSRFSAVVNICGRSDVAAVRTALQMCFSRIGLVFGLGKKTKRGQGYVCTGIRVALASSKGCVNATDSTPFWSFEKDFAA